MIPAEKIIVALDLHDRQRVSSLLKELQGMGTWVKIGMELFYAHGSEVVQEAKDFGHKVFLDLKLHDIPNTVAGSMRSLSRLPFDMINVHAAGGSEMMKKASEALRASNHNALLIAVTQLTSTTSQQMNAEQRIPGDILESVVHYAKLTKECGLNGVVSSPLEVQAIKLICGSRFLTVTPGIRPAGSDSQDQKRITTPEDAINVGADFMVIGRPITQAPHPREALNIIIKGQP